MSVRSRNALTALLALLLTFSLAPFPSAARFFPAAVFAVTAMYFALWARGNSPLLWTLPLAPLSAATLWAWLPGSTAAMQWTAYLILAFLATQLFGSARLRFHFQQFAVLFGAVNSIVAISQLLVSPANIAPAIGAFANRNHFAALMELLLPIACWEFAKSRQAIYAGAAGLMFLAVVMSTSRMGILLTAAELVILSIFAARRFRNLPWRPALAAAAVVAVLAAAAGGTAWQRFQGVSYDLQTSTRGLTARASIAMLRERPLRGFGLGTWAQVYPRFAETDTGFDLIHADDDWLEWAAEGGVPFVCFMLVIAGLAVANIWREPWSIGLAAVMIHSLTEFPLQKIAVMSWFVVLLAMSAMARRQHAS